MIWKSELRNQRERGGLPGLPSLSNSPNGLCGRKATLEKKSANIQPILDKHFRHERLAVGYCVQK